MTKSYDELIGFPDLLGRFEYLKLNGHVGEETFGCFRYLNQKLYHSDEWRRFKNGIIIRDHGCDLAIEGNEITGPITIHHINPISVSEIKVNDDVLFDPQNVVCVSGLTHKAIHYGSFDFMPKPYEERVKGDTCLWR